VALHAVVLGWYFLTASTSVAMVSDLWSTVKMNRARALALSLYSP